MIRKHHVAERYETPDGEVECQLYMSMAGKPEAIAHVERARVKSLIQGSFPHMVRREHQSEQTEKRQ